MFGDRSVELCPLMQQCAWGSRSGEEQIEAEIEEGKKFLVSCKTGSVSTVVWLSPDSDHQSLSYLLNIFLTVYTISFSTQHICVQQRLSLSYW